MDTCSWSADAYWKYPKAMRAPTIAVIITNLLDSFRMPFRGKIPFRMWGKKNPNDMCKNFDLSSKLLRASRINENILMSMRNG